MPMDKVILLVDDDSGILSGLARLGKTLCYQVTTAATSGEAVRRLREERFDLCVTALHHTGVDGRAVLEPARACRPPVATIMLSDHGAVADAVEALRSGAADVI